MLRISRARSTRLSVYSPTPSVDLAMCTELNRFHSSFDASKPGKIFKPFSALRRTIACSCGYSQQ